MEIAALQTERIESSVNAGVFDSYVPQGEKLDLNQLVEDHFDYLYNYAYRYFRSDDKAEDLVQDTFLAATEAISRFQGNSSPRTWLIGILRHKIMDKLRVKDREQPVDIQESSADLYSSLFNEAEHWFNETGPIYWGASPDTVLNQKQFLAALEECLSKLPSRVRQIFLLREMEDRDREEIGDGLGISSTNVGVILHRARLSLQNCLQQNWLIGGKAV